ncbi:class I SAM-dependent methyltransferase [Litorilinea aerophila]|uniref:Class I SAM-dependent methyltransferase n=1 Tax=Litorilinea aerophila TaxID=1204385 RepID=A0A540VD07_9CHLR|nr:class I SAM-dependent methyltransferase [Litorilinea aerophila]MCC9078245.1 class I SAM-dependent methyltransferase [Litorilinea aerophila]
MSSTDQNAIMDELRAHWEERYRQGPRPWDTGITPPEVVAFWQEHGPGNGGLALDLGCGTGTNVAFLARQGLRVLGFDYSGRALNMALQRIRRSQAALLPRLQLVQADVSRLPLHAAGACYILDIGCLHGLPLDRRPAYAQGVVDNLAPGGYYHLYAFDRPAEAGTDGPVRGMAPGEVQALFGPHLTVVQMLQGQGDRMPSRWYLLRWSST